MNPDLVIALSLLLVGFLYASVGHGGASGYIAVLSIFSIPVATYKPLILVLNIIIASIAFIQFYRAGYFKWKTTWPFLLTSIPCAFIGSKVHLAGNLYHLILGIALIIPVIRLIGFSPKDSTENKPVNLILALTFGLLIGFLSGLLNIGGGIFLSPVLILMAWANTKEAAAVSALFIVLNSVSGLLGNLSNHVELNSSSYIWFTAAIMGGATGAYFGSHRFAQVTVKYLLSTVLLIASVKLIFFM